MRKRNMREIHVQSETDDMGGIVFHNSKIREVRIFA